MTTRFPGRAWHPNAYPHIPFELNRNSPQAQGLVGWWPPLGSAGANILRNFRGRGSNGAFKAAGEPAWVGDAQFGMVLKFDGSDDYVDCGNAASFNMGSGNFAIFVWVKTSISRVTSEAVVWKRDWNGTSGTNTGYYTGIYGSEGGAFWGKPYLVFGSFATSNYCIKKAATAINDGKWHHVVSQRTGLGNTAEIWIDGINQILTDSSVGTAGDTDNTQALLIGKRTDISQVFIGSIADARIYNRALSAAEVWQQYAPETRYDLYRPQVRRVWHVPVAVGWPRISPSLATVAPQGPRVGGIYVS